MHFSKALLSSIFVATALAAPVSIDATANTGAAVNEVIRRALSTVTGAVSQTTEDVHELGADLRDNLNGAVVQATSAAPAVEDTVNDVVSGVPVVGGITNSTLTSVEGKTNDVVASAPGTLRAGEDTFEAVYTTAQDGINDVIN